METYETPLDPPLVSTDASATVSGSSSLLPSLGDHDYESIDSELSEEVRKTTKKCILKHA